MGDELDVSAKSRSGTVLVVDDDATCRSFANGILTEAGYTVFLANGPEQCMHQLLVVKPTIILLDVNLGRMSGYELCVRIKETYPNLRSIILFVTVNRSIDDVVWSKQAGGNYFMVKPYSAADLLTNIRKAMQAKQRRR